jgi:hypothetical protein
MANGWAASRAPAVAPSTCAVGAIDVEAAMAVLATVDVVDVGAVRSGCEVRSGCDGAGRPSAAERAGDAGDVRPESLLAPVAGSSEPGATGRSSGWTDRAGRVDAAGREPVASTSVPEVVHWVRVCLAVLSAPPETGTAGAARDGSRSDLALRDGVAAPGAGVCATTRECAAAREEECGRVDAGALGSCVSPSRLSFRASPRTPVTATLSRSAFSKPCPSVTSATAPLQAAETCSRGAPSGAISIPVIAPGRVSA